MNILVCTSACVAGVLLCVSVPVHVLQVFCGGIYQYVCTCTCTCVAGVLWFDIPMLCYRCSVAVCICTCSCLACILWLNIPVCTSTCTCVVGVVWFDIPVCVTYVLLVCVYIPVLV